MDKKPSGVETQKASYWRSSYAKVAVGGFIAGSLGIAIAGATGPKENRFESLQNGKPTRQEIFQAAIGTTSNQEVLRTEHGTVFKGTDADGVVCLVTEQGTDLLLDCSAESEIGREPIFSMWQNRPTDPTYFVGLFDGDVIGVKVDNTMIKPVNGVVFGKTVPGLFKAEIHRTDGSIESIDFQDHIEGKELEVEEVNG